MEQEFKFRTVKFTAPSGFSYTIREQNGEDEDILSNPQDARDLTNLIKFIVAIVVDTNYTTSGKLSLETARTMPLLDKYCILLHNRIFSLGNTIEFEHTFEDGSTYSFEQDLNELIFEDYTESPSNEELEAKPFAIPYYPHIPIFSSGTPDHSNLKDLSLILESGKELLFDLMDSNAERFLLKLPNEKRTRNSEFIARNLRLNVNGKYDKVTNFRLFSVREMKELRKKISESDPIFSGNIILENPNNPQDKEPYNILGNPDFFGFSS